MRIAILGCGYVGAAAAKNWGRERGNFITVSTRNPEKVEALKKVANKVVLIKDSLAPLLEGQDVLLVCVAPGKNDTYESTYFNTALALSSLLPRFPNIKQIIYTSSTSVYGECEGRWVDEKASLNSINPNIQCLIETERIYLQKRSNHLQVAVLRFGEITGPGRELVDRIKAKQAKGEAFPGTGENYVNLSPLDLVIQALESAVRRRLDGIYNVCTADHRKRSELYEEICQKNSLPSVVWNPNEKSPHGGNKRVSSSKFEMIISSKPRAAL